MLKRVAPALMSLALTANPAEAQVPATCCQPKTKTATNTGNLLARTAPSPKPQTSKKDWIFRKASPPPPSRSAIRKASPSNKPLPRRYWLHRPYLHWYESQDRRPKFYYHSR